MSFTFLALLRINFLSHFPVPQINQMPIYLLLPYVLPPFISSLALHSSVHASTHMYIQCVFDISCSQQEVVPQIHQIPRQ